MTDKQRRPWGESSDAIVHSIQRHGPATRAELCARLGMGRMYLAAVITRLSKASPKHAKRLYVRGYVYDQDGARRYPRAVYDVGDKPDARKPRPTALETRRRYDAAVKAKATANFVFNLGLSRDKVREMRRPKPVASVFELGDRAGRAA